MRLWLSGVALVLLLAGCGSSSGPTEAEAESLIDSSQTPYSLAECVKKSGRDFICRAETSERESVTIGVTVAESGESVVVTSCKANEGSAYLDPCEEGREEEGFGGEGG